MESRNLECQRAQEDGRGGQRMFVDLAVRTDSQMLCLRSKDGQVA